MAHESEELIADLLTQAQGPEGEGNRSGEERQWHHYEVLGQRRGQAAAEEHPADQEERQYVQDVADHGEAERGQHDDEPSAVDRGHRPQFEDNGGNPAMPGTREPGTEASHRRREDRRQYNGSRRQRD